MNLAEAQSAWQSLRKFVNDHSTVPVDSAQVRERTNKIRDHLKLLEAALEDRGGGLEAFFETVGNGLIRAQQSLDGRSELYNAESPPVPTAFRIPKVQAEISFSATERTGSGFIASVFTGSSSKEIANKHSISFEIVAAPPPPELIQGYLPWLASFVVSDLSTRASLRRVLDRFHTALVSAGNVDAAERAKGLLDQFNRCVIFRSPSTYLVLHFLPRSEDSPNDPVLEMLQLAAPEEPGSKANTFPEAKPTGGVKVKVLHAVFAGLIDIQSKRLSEIEKATPG